MKLAYIVLCHKLPQQVVRLVHGLNGDSVTFLLHVDRRAVAAAIAGVSRDSATSDSYPSRVPLGQLRDGRGDAWREWLNPSTAISRWTCDPAHRAGLSALESFARRAVS